MPQNKDKLYITASEWATMGGAKRKEVSRSQSLPFNYCSLSFTPFEMPVMTVHESISPSSSSASSTFNFAYLFEFMTIIPWIRKHGTHPITGKPLAGKDLIKVHFTKDKDNQYICPIMHKVFNEFSRIVVIKTTGNVFSYDAVESLNIQPKNYKDLLNDAPFTRNDIIWIQDPTNPEWIKNHDVNSFHHVKNTAGTVPTTSTSTTSGISTGNVLTVPTETKSTGGGVIRLNESTRKVLAEMDTTTTTANKTNTIGSSGGIKRPRDETEIIHSVTTVVPSDTIGNKSSIVSSANILDHSNSNTHITSVGIKTTGQYGASFTSTGMSVRTKNIAAPITDTDKQQLRYKEIMKRNKPAFVRIVTNKGPLNIELYAQLVPRTVENFLLLVKQDYYKNTLFHRSIRNFMIQGGDPTGTGRGGHSGFKDQQYIDDEFHPKLSHNERGLLSMANSGINTNGSQFFITYRSCPHLDRKHSIFGKVVGGLDTLRTLETVKTDKNDRPLEELKIDNIEIFNDPYQEYDNEATTTIPKHPSASNVTSTGISGPVKYTPGSTYSTVPLNNNSSSSSNTKPSSASSSNSSSNLLDILSNIGTKYKNNDNNNTEIIGNTILSSSSSSVPNKINPPVIGKYLNLSASTGSSSSSASSTTARVPVDPQLLQIALGHQHLSITGGETSSGSKDNSTASSGATATGNKERNTGGFQNFSSW